MNLLSYNNRFKGKDIKPATIPEVTGYMWAMQDFLKLIEQLTNFSADKRFIDASKLTESISETLGELDKVNILASQKLQNITHPINQRQ